MGILLLGVKRYKQGAVHGIYTHVGKKVHREGMYP